MEIIIEIIEDITISTPEPDFRCFSFNQYSHLQGIINYVHWGPKLIINEKILV